MAEEVFGNIPDRAYDSEHPDHFVHIGMSNETDVEWERCWYAVEGCSVWYNPDIAKNGAPPHRLKPNQRFSSKHIPNMAGLTIDVVLAYKKVGDGDKSEDQIVYAHIHTPWLGANTYYNSGLREAAEKYGFKLEESGNFRSEPTGPNGNRCSALFTVKKK